jgi:hypothetical protein
MREIQESTELVAHCGLFCGACRSYLKESCPGCHENEKATWCAVRSCCRDKKLATCADCVDFPNPRDCSKYNNFMARLFGFVFSSDRAACIAQIKTLGLDGHAKKMAELRIQTIKR